MHVQYSFDEAKGSRYTDGKSVLAKFRDGRELQALRGYLACTGHVSFQQQPAIGLLVRVLVARKVDLTADMLLGVSALLNRLIQCVELTVRAQRSWTGCDAVFVLRRRGRQGQVGRAAPNPRPLAIGPDVQVRSDPFSRFFCQASMWKQWKSAEALSRREIGPGGKGQSGRFEPRPPQASHALQWSDAISQAMVDRQGSWFSMEAKPERVHSLRYGLNDYPST